MNVRMFIWCLFTGFGVILIGHNLRIQDYATMMLLVGLTAYGLVKIVAAHYDRKRETLLLSAPSKPVPFTLQSDIMFMSVLDDGIWLAILTGSAGYTLCTQKWFWLIACVACTPLAVWSFAHNLKKYRAHLASKNE